LDLEGPARAHGDLNRSYNGQHDVTPASRMDSTLGQILLERVPILPLPATVGHFTIQVGTHIIRKCCMFQHQAGL
jgi:hypothetical protein